MNHSRKNLMERRMDGLRTARPGMRFKSRPHDVQNLYVSLKQWRILHAVVDCGGYAEAAKALYLSQSTISYTIAKLQEQLGVPLLRIDGRKAVLTPEGRALLERSRNVLKEAIELEALAKQLGQGCGGEVRLLVDENAPSDLLMGALRRFQSLSQGGAAIKLSEVPAAHLEEALRRQNTDLAVSESVPLGFLGEPLAEIEYLAVAHASHPLHALGRELTGVDLARHVRVSAKNLPCGESNASLANDWTMGSIDSAIAAVREGLGYAWLPAHRIHAWLDDGSLIPLPLVDRRSHRSMLYLIHGRPWMSTAAVADLAEVLRGFTSNGGRLPQ